MDRMRFLVTTLLILYATLAPAIAISNGIDRAHAAAPTLHAIVPRHIEIRSYDTLRPSLTGEVQYHDPQGDKSKPWLLVHSNTTFQYPTVILPQCGYVQSVACADGGIDVVFKDRESFEYAKDVWSGVADGEGKLLFVTESMDCCQTDQGVYVYWLVKDLVSEDWCLKVTVKAEEVEMDKACDEVSSAQKL
jgi:hypothetical protein